jgi:ubiquinone/menaquinone biosynthesis C-methylase UbiE
MCPVVSRYDAAAPTYDTYRALSSGVVDAIRATILNVARATPRPRLLDLGAGSGRIGHAFVAAGDDYVGVDLSLGMLRQFARRADSDGRAPRLVQADGNRLPFGDAAFDIVLLVQVFGGMDEWRPLVAEARRVLRPAGALVLGRTAMPADGIDSRMKAQLEAILADMGVAPERKNAREHVRRWLERSSRGGTPVAAAEWDAERTPQGFMERHRTGAQFSQLPGAIKDEALSRLSAWAITEFGSLDTRAMERHAFEVRVFTFREEVRR